ncbi:MAG: hypothetical protein WCN95_16760, partial [bacterium]
MMTISAAMFVLVSGLVMGQTVDSGRPQGNKSPASMLLSYELLKSDFLNLPLDKRLTMPLFWLHGEDHKILRDYVDRIRDGGNGSFVIEPRPHPDWLGPKFWSDFSAILDYAWTKGMGGYIYDEGKGWQSFNAGGNIPPQHKFKYLRSTAIDVTGPSTCNGSDYCGPRYIKTIAGRYDEGKD